MKLEIICRKVASNAFESGMLLECMADTWEREAYGPNQGEICILKDAKHCWSGGGWVHLFGPERLYGLNPLRFRQAQIKV